MDYIGRFENFVSYFETNPLLLRKLPLFTTLNFSAKLSCEKDFAMELFELGKSCSFRSYNSRSCFHLQADIFQIRRLGSTYDRIYSNVYLNHDHIIFVSNFRISINSCKVLPSFSYSIADKRKESTRSKTKIYQISSSVVDLPPI